MASPCLVTPGLILSRNILLFSGTYKKSSELGLLSPPPLSTRARDSLSSVIASLPLFMKSKSTITKLPCLASANCFGTPCWISCLLCLALVTVQVTSPTVTGSLMATVDSAPFEAPDFDAFDPESESPPPPLPRTAIQPINPSSSNTGRTMHPPKASLVPRHTVDSCLGGGGTE